MSTWSFFLFVILISPKSAGNYMKAVPRHALLTGCSN